MTTVDPRPIWLTYLGQTIFENLNPFWVYCETSGMIPSRTVLFYEREQEEQKERVILGLTAIAVEFGNKKIEIECIDFDDEDVGGFVSKTGAVFERATGERQSVVVDISPTTWSFVPVYLVKVARELSGGVQSVVYLQYGNHKSRQMPYILIPKFSITVHDLLRKLI